MRSIWKFKIDGSVTHITADVKKFLSIGEDPSGNLCVWAIVDPDGISAFDILLIGTGWDLEKERFNEMQFIGTVNDGPYMWHAFARGAELEKEQEHSYDEEMNYDNANMTVNFGGMTLGK